MEGTSQSLLKKKLWEMLRLEKHIKYLNRTIAGCFLLMEIL